MIFPNLGYLALCRGYEAARRERCPIDHKSGEDCPDVLCPPVDIEDLEHLLWLAREVTLCESANYMHQGWPGYEPLKVIVHDYREAFHAEVTGEAWG
jgi:hypothetical protein